MIPETPEPVTTPGLASSPAVPRPIALFAPAASAAFGTAVATALGIAPARHEEREFGGGEHKMRPLESVRGRATYVIQSLHGDARGSANDRLCRLLFFVATLKDAGAGSVTACIPYLAYARKDRRTKARDPVASRYVAQLVESVGTDRVVVLEVHNLAAFENAFRIPTVHLEATDLLAAGCAQRGPIPLAVASPDVGGVKRARHFQELLERLHGEPVAFAFVDKKRSGGIVSGDTLVGDVGGRRVILVDDMIDSGTTLLRAAAACRRAGAARVDAVATHAPLSSDALRLFGSDGPNSVLVTDSVALAPGFSAIPGSTLRICPIAPRFAEAIRRLEGAGPLTPLGGL
ncbi:MAG: ribose-phosphate pyrophosphokinase [Gammaproteobacteria bacterium]|nr:ribose-phosphate pyrophosphokinase [Gammaproteobacteria bacterium]